MEPHTDRDQLAELAAEVKRIVEENRKFVQNLMNEDFEPDSDDATGSDEER